MKRNPLNKRLPREIKAEFGKYAVIFILLVSTIGFVSGFLVADNSMMIAYNNSFTDYNIEDGHFITEKQMNRAQQKAAVSTGNTVYDLFYVEKELDNDSTLRIFANRDEVDKACVMEGELPLKKDEIAIDRMYAENNKIAVGDTISSGKESYTVTGYVALSDYSALFEDNSDTMFDSIKFGVGVVASEQFGEYDEDLINWCYAFSYPEEPKDEIEEKQWADDYQDLLNENVKLKEYIPGYLNQAIHFTGDDMGSDRVSMIVLLYIIIVIMAFVFTVTISDTITKEAAVIGTLRAMGYTRRELVVHYSMMPVVVTIIGAIIGNILGYTVIKGACAGMYYGSYSLPTYRTVWNMDAFVKTTVIPVVMMFVINIWQLLGKLKLSPLKFLRRDLSKRRQKRAVKLPGVIPFFTRFRLRVVFQNVSGYLVMLVGILFANLLLLFGLVFPSALEHYQDTIADHMLCKYQYMLEIPTSALDDDHKLKSMISMLKYMSDVETENEDAEKFTAYTLETIGNSRDEDVLLYGIEDDSRYIQLDVSDNKVYMSSAYRDKFGLQVGDTITLKEEYEDDTYTFTIAGVYDYNNTIALFMGREFLNETLDLGNSYFGGYFSDTEITDIDEKYVGSVIDMDAMTKISRQLMRSMGGMMYLVQGFAVLIFIVLVYLLSKIIIEKNSQSISMAKILGYNNGEISRLYIMSTSSLVVLFIFLSLPLESSLIRIVFEVCIRMMMNGWIEMYMSPSIFIETAALGLITYAIVAFLEYKKIKKVPMTDALKNAE